MNAMQETIEYVLKIEICLGEDTCRARVTNKLTSVFIIWKIYDVKEKTCLNDLNRISFSVCLL